MVLVRGKGGTGGEENWFEVVQKQNGGFSYGDITW